MLVQADALAVRDIAGTGRLPARTDQYGGLPVGSWPFPILCRKRPRVERGCACWREGLMALLDDLRGKGGSVLEEGLSMLVYSCEEFEIERL